MSAIPSESFSAVKKMQDVPIVNRRIVALDQGYYRRQIEHFEYYWGLGKGEIDLESPLNHIQLRADMAEMLEECDWVFMPTQETLQAIYRMAEYNKTADIQSRRNCFKEFPVGEYEYDFVPLYLLTRRPSLHIDRGSSTKAVRAPYRTMPRIKSRAHPLFVVFMASMQLDSCAALVMPEDKARALMDSVGDIVTCWLEEPPVEFLVGEDVWKGHRHPLSDDGDEVRKPVRRSRRRNATTQVTRVRKSTRAPCKQAKSSAAPKPYAMLNPLVPCARSSALPLPGVESGDDAQAGMGRSRADMRAWVEDVTSLRPAASPRPPRPINEEISQDEVLARYRDERARAADDALEPLNSVLLGSGLIIGNGLDWSGYSSNNWATRIHGICLLGKDPFAKAPQ